MSADDIIHEVQRPGPGEVAQGPERRAIVRRVSTALQIAAYTNV
jgi:hypothetical protein